MKKPYNKFIVLYFKVHGHEKYQNFLFSLETVVGCLTNKRAINNQTNILLNTQHKLPKYCDSNILITLCDEVYETFWEEKSQNISMGQAQFYYAQKCQ